MPEKQSITNILIGADPEVFLQDKATGELISAIGLIGGTKRTPRKISEAGHYVQEDNVSVEFNIPPSKTAEAMTVHISKCLDWIKKNIHDNLEISNKCSGEFNPEYLDNDQAKQFGCEPDFNAWTAAENDKPDSDTLFRSCGGHVHIGYSTASVKKSIRLVQALDLFLGVPSVLLDPDTQRRRLYGAAGACRMKSYGVEYRVLSNFWIFDALLIQWVFNNSLKAVNFVNNGHRISDPNAVVAAITGGDKMLASTLIKQYTVTMPSIMAYV